ncbi:MAG: hypothetical protein PVJ57_06450 [Phycisphaerae bacterium]|jgi:hypothetical protein
MWQLLCTLLLLMPAAPQEARPQVVPVRPADAVAQETPPVTSAPTYDEGPLRCEVAAIFDARYWYKVTPPRVQPSVLQMRLQVMGDRITQVARAGEVIFTEAVDDTGKALIDPNSYTDEQREALHPLRLSPEQLRAQGLLLPASFDSPDRAARSIKLRGTVKVVLAEGREEITIDNPLQYAGKTIENELLRKLGVVVRIVPPDELEATGPAKTPAELLALEYVEKGDHINTVNLVDAWMKRLAFRQQPMKTKDGRDVVTFTLGREKFTEETQLVLEVFTRFEEVVLPIDQDSVTLP